MDYGVTSGENRFLSPTLFVNSVPFVAISPPIFSIRIKIRIKIKIEGICAHPWFILPAFSFLIPNS